MSADPHDPNIEQRIQELSKALREEFAVDQRNKKTIEDIAELKDDALETLRFVLKHSQSEPLRAKVAMWAYERVLDSENKAEGDSLRKLIEDMPAATTT